MSDLTDYAENQFMDWAFFNTSFAATHTTVYISLHTADPGEPVDSTTEVGASDYDREPVTADSTEWSSDTSGSGNTVTNDNAINFGTATNDWGDISHFGIYTDTANNSGNPIFTAALDTTKTVNTDDEVRFQSNDLTADID